MIDPRSSPPPLPPYIVLFGPRGNCTLELCPVVYSVYGYRPSPAANGTFIALFVLAGMIHIYQGIRYKTWFVVTTVTIGCISGILGYIGRLMLYNNPFQFSAFMLQMSKPLDKDRVHLSELSLIVSDCSLRYIRTTVLLCCDLCDACPNYRGASPRAITIPTADSILVLHPYRFDFACYPSHRRRIDNCLRRQ